MNKPALLPEPVNPDNPNGDTKNVAVVILLTIAAFIGAQLVSGIVVTVLALTLGGETPDSVGRSGSVLFSAPYLFGAAGLFYTLLAIMVGLLTRFRRMTRAQIGLRRPEIKDLNYGLIGYGLYFLAFAAVQIIVAMLSPELLKPEQQLGFSRSAEGLALVPIFLSLVLLPAFSEELLCRGFLFSGLRLRLMFLPATIITSLLFAAPHLGGGEPGLLLWMAALDTFILSLALCYSREKTGRLWAPMLTHGLKNFLAFSVLFIFKVA